MNIESRHIYIYACSSAPTLPYPPIKYYILYIYIYICFLSKFQHILFKIVQQGDTVNVPQISARQDTSVLNHRRFCNWTDRSPEELSQELVRDVYRACVAVEKLRL